VSLHPRSCESLQKTNSASHYQLRHLISSPEPDLLYYASAKDIYCLNVATKTQAKIASLTWEARCTASGYGYVCVGCHDNATVAIIKVKGFPPADPTDVDALLPLHFLSRTTLPRPPRLASPSQPKYETIGDDIVNSISIHKLPNSGDRQDDVVAVLTNNDKSVRIFSLKEHKLVATLRMSFPMNHATISPDGQLLVAVGDKHIGYFFKRTQNNRTAKTVRTTEEQADPPDWTLIQEVSLYVPSDSSLVGYFATAWSPSGHLCAMGSESGYITVFDMELLKRCEYGEDAIIQVISSTRPDLHGSTAGPGAIRTMQFSPAPWDLLVWSEDQARVCVADIRSDLKVKQILALDSKEEGLNKVHIADFDVELNPTLSNLQEEEDFIRRYRRTLDTEGNAAAVDLAYDHIDAERRQPQRHRGVVESDNDPHGLTAHERQVLEALRTTRQRDGSREQAPTPRSINYNTFATPALARRYILYSHFIRHKTDSSSQGTRSCERTGSYGTA
jgi:WD40 repeat protein